MKEKGSRLRLTNLGKQDTAPIKFSLKPSIHRPSFRDTRIGSFDVADYLSIVFPHCYVHTYYCLQVRRSQENRPVQSKITVDIYLPIQHILDMNTNPTHHQNIIITIP